MAEPFPLPNPTGGADLPMDEDTLTAWKTRIERSQQRLDEEKPLRDANLQALRGTPLTMAPEDETVYVPKDFANVHQKAPQLFFRSPEVQVTPQAPLAEGREDAIQMFQAVLNQELGPHAADAKRAVDKAIVDVLCPAGMGATKIGYLAVESGADSVMTGSEPQLGPDGAPAVDPLTGAPAIQPLYSPRPRIGRELWFWDHFSVNALLVPHDFYDNDFDRAPWLGRRFTQPLRLAVRDYGLPETFEALVDVDKHRLLADEAHSGSQDTHDQLIEGVEIWYQTALYDPEVADPFRYRELVLIEGLDRPARHRDSPYQRLGPEGFVDDKVSMLGNPIHVLTIRDFPDSAYQPSDCAVTRNPVNELGVFRTQMVRQRACNKPQNWYDRNRVDSDDVEKFRKNKQGSWVGVDGNGNEILGQVTKAEIPRENYTAQQYIEHDINELWAMGPNQRGVQDDTARTATETQTLQQNSSVRLDAERNRVIDWYLKGVQKFAALILQFFDPPDLVNVIGESGTQRFLQWRPDQMSVRWAYTIKPDSAIRMDAAADRAQFLQFVNFFAKHPFMNQQELAIVGCRKFGFDPAKLIKPPQPSGPPPPNVSFRFSGEDLVGPQAPMVLEIMMQAGYKVSQGAMQASQRMVQIDVARQRAQAAKEPEHGGAADQADTLGPKPKAPTGGMPGLEQRPPIGPGLVQ